MKLGLIIVIHMDSFFCKKGSVKKVAIIGAGVSGLTAIKACLEEDLHPVCFERSCYIGGLWSPAEKTNFDNKASVYPSLIFNSSKEMSCFSDFPYPKSYPPFIRPRQQYEYLESYADHFGLGGYIKFNTCVMEVSSTSDMEDGEDVQKWNVRWQLKADQLDTATTEGVDLFDAVLVCNGNSTEAILAAFPDQDKFKGRILHSCHFREGSDFKDQRVLVIGISEYQKGTFPIPRLLNGGVPPDAMFNTLLGSYVPRWVKMAVFARIMSSLYNLRDVGLEPNQRDSFTPVAMINDEMIERIISGMVIPRPSVQRFTEDGVVFTDGTQEKVDAVLMATGYRMIFPFVDDKILADDPFQRSLYLHIFAITPERPTLAVVGLTSHRAAAGPVFEVQARCAVAVFKGDVRLPSKAVMAKETDETKEALIKEHGKLKYLVLPVSYICQLLQLIGCYPSVWYYLLKGDFQLASRLLFKPFYPYVTRLRGKHAWPGARQAIIDGMDNMFSATRNPPSTTKRSSHSRLIVILLVLSCMILLLVRTYM